VAVVVAAADADEGDARADPGVEVRMLLGGAVVRDLDDVHRRHAADLAGECGLGAGLEVAEGEDMGALDVGRENDAGVVDAVVLVAAVLAAACSVAGRRPQDTPRDRPAGVGEATGQAGGRRRHGGAGSVDGLGGLPVAVVRPLARAGENRRAAPAAECAGDAPDVVGVEVREHDQVERLDAPAAEAAVDERGVGAGVDEHGTAVAAAQEHGVALTDVALDDRPVGDGAAMLPPGREEPADGERDHEERDRPREPAAEAEAGPGG
jgi:hypothetical protein